MNGSDDDGFESIRQGKRKRIEPAVGNLGVESHAVESHIVDPFADDDNPLPVVSKVRPAKLQTRMKGKDKAHVGMRVLDVANGDVYVRFGKKRSRYIPPDIVSDDGPSLTPGSPPTSTPPPPIRNPHDKPPVPLPTRWSLRNQVVEGLVKLANTP
ncbi:hypothetical protein FRX31_021611 [Thalictrum thalictroides]|uniref:Uncharacterized protein n=1 Tax=Thalictrum thalictroides TaxID=46969 RepID=A0A7J6VWW0_THATH|nr:hypothetical protein FRX31_021611 [Thalictrum thalictroides]